MSRKRWSILFISLAYGVLLLHSITPHHHHEDDLRPNTANASLYPSNDDDGGHGIDHSLRHAFAHFQHDPGVQVTYLQLDQHLDPFDWQPLEKVFLDSFYAFLLPAAEEPRPFLPSPPDAVPETPGYTSPNILRGPPAPLV